jgi:hypothetical protein
LHHNRAKSTYGAAGLIAGALPGSSSRNIGWVAKINMALGIEYDVPALHNGMLVKSLPCSISIFGFKGLCLFEKVPW